jgi:hypothetical protein
VAAQARTDEVLDVLKQRVCQTFGVIGAVRAPKLRAHRLQELGGRAEFSETELVVWRQRTVRCDAERVFQLANPFLAPDCFACTTYQNSLAPEPGRARSFCAAGGRADGRGDDDAVNGVTHELVAVGRR